jgi:hypothetical protein
MKELIWRIQEKLFPDEKINIVASEDGELPNGLGSDEINIVFPVLSKDFHFVTVSGVRIKHSDGLFKQEGCLDYSLEGFTVARYKGSTIYLVFSSNEEAESLLESIMKELVPKAIDAVKSSFLRQFKLSVTNAIESRVQEYRDRIKDNESEAAKLEQQILTLRRQVNTDSKAVEALEGTKGQWIQKAQKEFGSLQHLIPNYYEGFRVDDGKLIAKTHEVSITFEGCSYDIGVFEVRITLATGDLEIANLTHEVEGYQHPHISDGSPCLGNIGNGVIRMLAEFELFGALQMIHSFLHSYNEDSPYCKIEHWDPNYEDEESSHYENCHEDNYGYTCVECGGENGACPFYDEAFEVCLENAKLEDCTSCDYQCRLGRERIRRHQQQQSEAA